MRRVLLVDDDPLMTKITCRSLTRAGFEVEVSNHSFGVLNLVAELLPDVLVMDMNMPGLRGIELLELIRSDASLSKTCVVFYSGVELHELAGLASAGGADGFVHKSASPGELIEMISTVPIRRAASKRSGPTP